MVRFVHKESILDISGDVKSCCRGGLELHVVPLSLLELDDDDNGSIFAIDVDESLDFRSKYSAFITLFNRDDDRERITM